MASLAAPWRSKFLSQVDKMPMAVFALSTLAKAPASDAVSPGEVIPRVRYVIYRGMWGSPNSDDRNKAEANPKVYESDCIIMTTDARMEKPDHIQQSLEEQGKGDDILSGTGGGGPVEAAFWIDEAKTQWRVRGDAWVLGPDVDGSSKETTEAKKAVEERMRVIDEKDKDKWSWAKELTYVFGAHSPDTKGSFANPSPGQKMQEGEDFQPVQAINDLSHPEARKNFRVVVIRPFEVEELELKSPSKRYRYTYGKDGSWNTDKVWP